MEEKKKSPELRFAGYKEDWNEAELGLLAEFTKGQGYSKNDLKAAGTPIILYGRLYTNYQTVIEEVDTYAIPQENSFYSAGGEVIVPASGETQEDIVRASVVTKTGVILGGDLNIIKPNELINSNFLALTISNGKVYQELVKKAQGKSVVHIRNNDLKEAIIPYPIKDEQQQIDYFFKNIDELITKHQKKHNRLVTLKKSMLEKMFPNEMQTVPEIRFKGFEGDWESDELNNFGNTYTGLSGKTKKDFGHGDAEYITYMNVFSNPIANPSLTDSVEIDNSQNCVEYGDVLFTVSSETPEEVGFSSVWTQKEKNIYLNSFCFGYRPTKRFDLTFLANAFRSNAFRKKITLLAQGISRFNISKTKAMNLELSFPDYDEQVKIGLYFKDLEGLISSHKKQLQKLNNFKQSLSEKMFV